MTGKGLYAAAAATALAALVAALALLTDRGPPPQAAPEAAADVQTASEVSAPAPSQDRRRETRNGRDDESADASGGDQPGVFDYYILSLSWSPSFCEAPAVAEREPMQCAADRPFSFVVHGLWPQYETGYPEECPTKVEAPPALVDAQLDMMPSPRLVARQWVRHGACSGLSPEKYFAATRSFRERITVPTAFTRLERPLSITGAEVERAFVEANPGLEAGMIAVQCRRNRLREVRICFTRDGALRACARDVRDQCGEADVIMPPVRRARG
jgi:ribonuclease T2